ncbi:ABC transporter permease (plasmid) [Mesorhizobium sp. 131-2-5]|uniref:ABC transporter permease n=1 Tax=Mesorhizobium sp. 131-2-5 TaxID=2744519 RepID=UPI0018EC559B|nr:ABC transporter permease [Mesorhizobium sp. 131-2-5]BCH05249.1 ABC transporter permease [Mesorhizobium sp. 131-2-5]
MTQILRMIVRRVGMGVATLFFVSILTFVSVEILPGDLAQATLGQSATPEALAEFRKEVGLDQPAFTRYVSWVNGMLHGDLGRSLANGKEISGLIQVRLKNTLFLGMYAASIAVPLSLIFGIFAALYRDSASDKVINATALTAISLPEFFVSYILVVIFSGLGWFPALASIRPDMNFSERLYVAFLPALALTFAVTAHMLRMTRAAIVNILSYPYIEMARLKGVRPWRIIVAHAVPNAISPIVNVVALNLAYLLTGVVVVEVVFGYPGLGQLMVDAVTRRDVTVVQSVTIIFASAYVLLNLAADIISTVSNPRVFHARRNA